MRIKGTKEQLEARRSRALVLLKQGNSPTEVAKAVGAARSTIYEWRDKQAGKPIRRSRRQSRRSRRPGGQSKLSDKQIKQLERELSQGAPAYGFLGDYWTLERVVLVIWQKFAVRYSVSGTWHVLQRMGWSSQKQQRVCVKRSDEAVAEWRQKIWPRLKKVR
jgi:transposase